jgi:hypothetical protein
MIRRWLVIVSGVALLSGATLTACGDDSGSSSGGGSSASDNAVTITASEYKFDVSGDITGGFAQVTFKNDGKEPHILVPLKLQAGKTAADALPLLEAEGQPDPEQIAAVFDGDPTTSFYGAPGLLEPGGSETTIADLPAGNYVLACFLPTPDGKLHASLGMAKDFTVGAGDNSTAPESKGTIEITSDKITAPDGVTSGTYAVTNSGEDPSDFNVLGPTDATPADVDAAIGAYFGAIGTGDVPDFKLPAPLIAGFSETMPVGATGYIVIDPAKGRYLMGGNTDDSGKTIVSGEFTVS